MELKNDKIRIYTTNEIFKDKTKSLNLSENAGLDLYLDLSEGIKESIKFSVDEYVPPEITINGDIIKISPIGGLTSYPFILYVKTGVYLDLPQGVHAIVSGRSGRFFKDSIDVFRGIIDSSYRGEIVVGLIVYRKTPTYLNINNAIAQLVFLDNTNLMKIDVEFVNSREELSSSSRGDKGFGSSDNGKIV